jgi:L-aspartate oxidase
LNHDGTGERRERLAADVVVVGAGVAGLSAALGLAPQKVLVITKAAFGFGGSSVWAQGGVAVAMASDDAPALHVADTLAAGAGIVDPRIADLLAHEGPGRIERLLELGAEFDRDERGGLAFGREAAHSRRRILHAHGDATGAEMVRALSEAVRHSVHVEVREHVTALDLVVSDGVVRGLWARSADGNLLEIAARAVVLGTGGIGRVYARTTNPVEATGDGLAMAARAGARLADLEFVQFHPTALAVENVDPMPLLTEALRGEGAVLLDSAGRRFMLDEHPDAELAPRDVVARAIWRRQRSGPVLLDARAAVGGRFPERFPTVFALCREHGLDPRSEPVPVSPAAHYHMGGIAVDARGRTTLPGLWACGEAASTGVHGANRLASNSLLEALVFGARVAEDISHRPRREARFAAQSPAGPLPAATRGADDAAIAELRATMWADVGLERSADTLLRASSVLAGIAARAAEPGAELRNLLLVGRLVAASALRRRESRGGHYRVDFPQEELEWQRRQFATAASLGVLDEPARPRSVGVRGAR